MNPEQKIERNEDKSHISVNIKTNSSGWRTWQGWSFKAREIGGSGEFELVERRSWSAPGLRHPLPYGRSKSKGH